MDQNSGSQNEFHNFFCEDEGKVERMKYKYLIFTLVGTNDWIWTTLRDLLQ